MVKVLSLDLAFNAVVVTVVESYRSHRVGRDLHLSVPSKRVSVLRPTMSEVRAAIIIQRHYRGFSLRLSIDKPYNQLVKDCALLRRLKKIVLSKSAGRSCCNNINMVNRSSAHQNGLLYCYCTSATGVDVNASTYDVLLEKCKLFGKESRHHTKLEQLFEKKFAPEPEISSNNACFSQKQRRDQQQQRRQKQHRRKERRKAEEELQASLQRLQSLRSNCMPYLVALDEDFHATRKALASFEEKEKQGWFKQAIVNMSNVIDADACFERIKFNCDNLPPIHTNIVPLMRVVVKKTVNIDDLVRTCSTRQRAVKGNVGESRKKRSKQSSTNNENNNSNKSNANNARPKKRKKSIFNPGRRKSSRQAIQNNQLVMVEIKGTMHPAVVLSTDSARGFLVQVQFLCTKHNFHGLQNMVEYLQPVYFATVKKMTARQVEEELDIRTCRKTLVNAAQREEMLLLIYVAEIPLKELHTRIMALKVVRTALLQSLQSVGLDHASASNSSPAAISHALALVGPAFAKSTANMESLSEFLKQGQVLVEMLNAFYKKQHCFECCDLEYVPNDASSSLIAFNAGTNKVRIVVLWCILFFRADLRGVARRSEPGRF